jgi:hypothetical protein
MINVQCHISNKTVKAKLNDNHTIHCPECKKEVKIFAIHSHDADHVVTSERPIPKNNL